MTTFGVKLMSELRDARTLVDQARLADQRGYDFVGISDHYLPWVSEHEHSPFAWSVLGAVAAVTERVDLVTMVTCPILRYHPALVAQFAGTVGSLSGGRLKLGLGSGEELNEHVLGQPWPAPDERHAMLEEAIEVMRMLFTGDRVVHRGTYYDVDRARLFDLPDEPIELLLAVSGPDSVALAAETCDGIVGTDDDASLIDGFGEAGGDRSNSWTEIPMAWAPTVEEGARLAHERFRFGALGWPVQSELPDQRNFDDATAHVTPEMMAEQIPCGPDPEPFVEAFRSYIDAGYEHIALLPVGDDLPGLLDFFESEVKPRL